ncbi:uncharacterized protein LOC131425571 [Malaya genurostris]|uniref:uncharacterized protein LOC131425571 n=1 Tax=Malaya genurostris TaxID=325434 RepID=UPI0026F384C0|nr:uncharacterized protein LOC131425571 [Malaya genurostris]
MSHIRQIRQTVESLQPQNAWIPMSEFKDQFTVKFPLREESAQLINSAPRINYIGSSQSALRNDLIKSLKINPKQYDSLNIHTPADSYRFGLNCNKAVDRPTSVIYTNETGFAKEVDPYVSVTTRDYPPQKQSPNDYITFWNWNSHQLNGGFKKPTTVQRKMISVPKKQLQRSFTSEQSAQYQPPASNAKPKLSTVSTKLVVLEPTDPMERSTEYSTYGSGINCARVLKQSKF